MRVSLQSLLILFVVLLTHSISVAGDTPLHTAALAGDIKTAKRLIAEGADINIKDQSKKTPIQLAIAKRAVEFCRWYVTLEPILSAEDKYKLRRMGIVEIKENRPPPDSKKTSVYDDVARATGGAVYKPEKGMEGMSDIMIANMGSHILLNREIDLKGVERISLPVEDDLGMLMFSVTAVRGKPVVTIKGPDGNTFTSTTRKSNLKIVSLKNGMVYIFNEPQQGNWRVEITGGGNIHVQVKAKRTSSRQRVAKKSSSQEDVLAGRAPVSNRRNAIDFYKFEFVELGGRPGHQGYFKTKRPLIPGQEMIAEATVFGSPQNVRFQLIQKNGKPFPGGTKLERLGVGGSDDYYLKVRVPKKPFRVLVSGKDANGKPFQRTNGFTITPDTQLLVYEFKPKEKLSPQDCSVALFYLQAITSQDKKSSAYIRCDIKEAKAPSFKIEFTFYIPKSPAKSKEYVFYSDPRYKYKPEDCAGLNKFFGKFEKQIKKQRLTATLTAKCHNKPAPAKVNLKLSIKK
ncbi:MAG: ankyrin repeat domain-containing protein [Nitrospinales bacterium]